jgi:hypothetical protein
VQMDGGRRGWRIGVTVTKPLVEAGNAVTLA